MAPIKTPSSLAWLINLKARRLGELHKNKKALALATQHFDREIARLEKELEIAKQRLLERRLERQIKVLKTELSVIEKAFKFHVIQINTSLIRGIRPQRRNRDLPFGAITKSILACLRETGRPTNAEEVAHYICAHYVLSVDLDFFELKLSVRKRMKTLCAAGKLKRLHVWPSDETGYWILSDSS